MARPVVAGQRAQYLGVVAQADLAVEFRIFPVSVAGHQDQVVNQPHLLALSLLVGLLASAGVLPDAGSSWFWAFSFHGFLDFVARRYSETPLPGGSGSWPGRCWR